MKIKMETLPFIKAHGLGNDFVIIFYEDGWNDVFSWQNNRFMGKLSQFLGNRPYGIGCDQIIYIYEKGLGADPFIRFFNPDGSEAETCGNGLRCVGRILLEKNNKEKMRLNTKTGCINVYATGQDLLTKIEMPWPKVDKKLKDKVIAFLNDDGFYDDLNDCVQAVDVVWVGNPHLVFLIKAKCAQHLEALALKYGPVLEKSPLFPLGINVNFAHYMAPDKVELTVWERGAGLTYACGSGACATSFSIANLFKLKTPALDVTQKGGVLAIDMEMAKSPLSAPHLYMTGLSDIVYEGAIPAHLIACL